LRVFPSIFFRHASSLKSSCPIGITEVNEIIPDMKNKWTVVDEGWLDKTGGLGFSSFFIIFFAVGTTFFTIFCHKLCSSGFVILGLYYLFFTWQFLNFFARQGDITDGIDAIDQWNEVAKAGLKNLNLCVDA
jgi:hypothetical protein